MKFKYDKLAQPDREIRIAVLQPGVLTDPVAVRFVRRKLEVLALSSLHNSPRANTLTQS